jgi:sec-independent protein translocase protein TatB
MGKARKMASEFQGQFNEAMREAEMADLKKQFDDVTTAAKDLSPTNLLTSMTKDVNDAMKVDLPEPPSLSATPPSSSASSPALPEPSTEPAAIAPTEPVPAEPPSSTFTEAEAHALLVEKPADASPGAPPDHPVENPAPRPSPATPDVKAP